VLAYWCVLDTCKRCLPSRSVAAII